NRGVWWSKCTVSITESGLFIDILEIFRSIKRRGVTLPKSVFPHKTRTFSRRADNVWGVSRAAATVGRRSALQTRISVLGTSY
ncbi:hypothetical protein CDAR_266861, partial [Caerostris darwini]